MDVRVEMSAEGTPLTVVHVIPSIASEASGPSYSVRRLCESLLLFDTSVTLAALESSVPVTSVPFLKTFPVSMGPHRLGRSTEMCRWLRSVAEGGEVDLFHNHSLWMMPNVYPGWAAKRCGIPLMVSPRGTLSTQAMGRGSRIKLPFWHLVQRPALRGVRCFHATAHSEYEDIRRLGFREPVAVIPNGIDLPAIRPKTVAVDRTLLFLGRINPIKGLDMLLPAWQVVQDRFPEWRLRLVGPDDGNYLNEMKQTAHELQLRRIEFSGPLQGEAKWQAYRDADLFVLPSYSENFGVAVAEALASGTPAIVSKGAPWAALDAKRAGWWVDVGIDPLVRCLENALVESPEALAAMGLRGRDWMQSEFSWSQVGLKMAATYRWIIDGGHAPEWVLEN